MRLLSVVVLCVAALHCTDALALKTCERDFKKIGCYDEYYPKKGDLIFTQRDEVLWGDIAAFMHHLACRCNEEVKKENEKRATTGKEAYVGFALHYWGECFGKTKSHTDALMGKDKSHRCTGSQDYNGCADEHAECVGHANAEYVYMLPSKSEESVDGGYTEWMDWTPCTGRCGKGYKVRERTCTNPVPKGKGKDCSDLGNSTEIGACDTGKPCPVDGEYGPWKNFGACTKSCGGGTQTRTRPCNNPAPNHGGKECEGPASESRPCNVESCPVDGKYGPWGSFGACSKSCGGGVKRRTRSCNTPSPSHGGKECTGAASETRSCNTKKCPVNGGYSSWGRYGSCSKSCGGGRKTRSRSCNNPSPKHGGKGCSRLGSATETASCNTHVCLSREYTKRACENGNVHLSCGGSSRIMLTHALYGRKTKSICGGSFSFLWNSNCGAGSSWSKVHGSCNGRKSCSVGARNSVFGDPCWGTPKYLEVKFRCKG